MEKRARFQSRWLPYALIAPQMVITLVFFFLPAGQAVYQSLMVQDAFGISTQFVWFDNFKDLFRNDEYLASFRVTAMFSFLVAVLGLSISLFLAVLADRVVRSATIYKTLLIEAAAIDGAGPVKRFVTIVFPLLSPTTFFLLVVNIIYAFIETFAIIDAATGGGPGQATQILVYKVYADGFKGLDLGSSYAQSVVLMVILITLTVVQFRYVE